MNIEGWIPREVIIDREDKYRYGNYSRFIVQWDDYANPQSFLLTIDSLLNKNKIDSKYLNQIYPRLKAWFQWFNTSQSGSIASTYRWRGRTPDKLNRVLNPDTYNSGFDDFPRATHPTDSEYHLDLRCWIALSAKIMKRIAKTVNDSDSELKYEETEKLLSDNILLERLHWSEEHKAYCDFGLHSTNVSLEFEPKLKYKVRKVWTPPEYQLTCDQLGYGNLHPFLFGLIDANNTKLEYVLNSIANESQFWTPFGLRSVSKTSFYYNKFNSDWEAPYWRGSIWINVNYLALRALTHYSIASGPNQTKAKLIYENLRKNLIQNMFRQYTKSGFLWENYNDMTGAGHDSHPFDGWSGVILLIMSEIY